MATFVKWFAPARFAEIQKDQRRKMEKAVRLVRNEIVKSLGVKWPPPSVEGEAPHLRTGELRRSIATQVDDENDNIVGRVGTNKEYATYLELPAYLNRPFFVPAVQRTRHQVAAIFAKPVK